MTIRAGIGRAHDDILRIGVVAEDSGSAGDEGVIFRDRAKVWVARGASGSRRLS